MKSSVIRSQRGRSNKVTKPGPPARGRAPRPATAQHLAAHDAHDGHVHGLDDDDLKGDPASVFDDVAMGAQDYAAAAAAAMDTDLNEDAHGEAEPEADMDDGDDGTGAASGLPPHVDLTAANILANGGAGAAGAPGSAMSQPPAAHMAAAQQMPPAHQAMDPSMMKTTEEMARDSGYGELNIESALAKRLAREPGQRLAQQRRPEQVLNLARRSNVEALFAHIAGEPARVPCKNCHKGHGPWTSCIVVDGQMCGSCANCWFNASGARCSFHETRNPQLVPQHPAILPANNAGLANDPAYRFSASHPLLQPHGGAMGAVNHPGVLLTNNPVLLQLVNRAMGEVRAADKATRQLIQIDITAKQLALQIAEYEEMVGNPETPGGAVTGQQVMGDEAGA
ncbi:cfa4933b-1dec-44f3-83b4-73de4837a35b [Thermothielavioides terrestris]|uniref:Cfa4933b-1dec-44f3-83b4-73de4837a35b n=1 Tax=Thermothielavioides terrestris TaxID=2587410 RepID=A0A446BJV2_9PEZI|nr:cfa4933b-1dec-44f3-83b4-73de4837a35b [Thermothielavioides terrestris]